jgi:hypothetical protein
MADMKKCPRGHVLVVAMKYPKSLPEIVAIDHVIQTWEDTDGTLYNLYFCGHFEDQTEVHRFDYNNKFDPSKLKDGHTFDKFYSEKL